MNSEISEENFVDFTCPHCGAVNSFPASATGAVRECVNCLKAFLAPNKTGGEGQPLPLPAESATIRLRQFEPGDWKALLEFQCEDENEATALLERASKVRFATTGEILHLAAEATEGGKIIGTVGLRFTVSELDQIEILFWANDKAGAENLYADAVDTALDFCFHGLALHRVVAQCESEDSEGRQLFQKSGLRQEAEFIKEYSVAGEWRSRVWFAILEEEYFGEAPANGVQSS